MGKFPIQTGKERKEQLYMRAIELFDRGKSWECGIPLCKELAHQYEAELFDYTKLAAILVSGYVTLRYVQRFFENLWLVINGL